MESISKFLLRIPFFMVGLGMMITGCDRAEPTAPQGKVADELFQPELPASEILTDKKEPKQPSSANGRQVIETFLESKSPAERAELIWEYDDPENASLHLANKNFKPFGNFALKFEQMETDTAYGGPFMMYNVSTVKDSAGFPVIVRGDGEKYKIDFELFNEFRDQHFVKFIKADSTQAEGTFKIIFERQTGYYESDAREIENLNSYHIYKARPPYGDSSSEFECIVFALTAKYYDVGEVTTEIETTVSEKAAKLMPMNSPPLAVTVKLKRGSLAEGKTHFLLEEIVTDGWFHSSEQTPNNTAKFKLLAAKPMNAPPRRVPEPHTLH